MPLGKEDIFPTNSVQIAAALKEHPVLPSKPADVKAPAALMPTSGFFNQEFSSGDIQSAYTVADDKNVPTRRVVRLDSVKSLGDPVDGTEEHRSVNFYDVQLRASSGRIRPDRHKTPGYRIRTGDDTGHAGFGGTIQIEHQ